EPPSGGAEERARLAAPRPHADERRARGPARRDPLSLLRRPPLEQGALALPSVPPGLRPPRRGQGRLPRHARRPHSPPARRDPGQPGPARVPAYLHDLRDERAPAPEVQRARGRDPPPPPPRSRRLPPRARGGLRPLRRAARESEAHRPPRARARPCPAP